MKFGNLGDFVRGSTIQKKFQSQNGFYKEQSYHGEGLSSTGLPGLVYMNGEIFELTFIGLQ